MRPQYSITRHPSPEPLTYPEAASHLRVDSTDDMEEIESLICVAREYVDGATGRVSGQTSIKLIADSWESLKIDANGVFPILRTPLVLVASIKYYAPDASSLTTMDAADYRVIADSEPGMIQIIDDAPEVDTRPDAIQIEFTAGKATSCSVPPTHKHAIKMMVAHLYENRTPSAPVNMTEIPFGLKALIESQKIGGWFE